MYYPVILNLENKNVVIIGGGNVAFRKMKNLFKAGANITVISHNFINDFKDYDLNYIRDDYDKKYLRSMFLVIGATSSRDVNNQVYKDAQKSNILCNIVDSKDESDFITPAIVENENLIINISTKGKYPALSKLIRKDLEYRYKKYDEEYMQILENIRTEVLKNYSDNKARLINEALGLNIDGLKEFYNKLIKDS